MATQEHGSRCSSARGRLCLSMSWVPVRALGSYERDRKPLLNAKLLVLGHLALNVYDPDNGYGEEVLDFEPRTVWWGSANWTVRAGSHWKLALHAVTALVEEATAFVADVIAFSEPIGTTCAVPGEPRAG